PLLTSFPLPSKPPQTIIFVPVQTAEWPERPAGAFVVVVAVQEFPTGSYWPPVLTTLTAPAPPQTIIFEPVQTAVAFWRAVGAPLVVVADHPSWTLGPSSV